MRIRVRSHQRRPAIESTGSLRTLPGGNKGAHRYAPISKPFGNLHSLSASLVTK
jgi:hypothetical protein